METSILEDVAHAPRTTLPIERGWGNRARDLVARASAFRRWHWLLVPLLAVIAYLTVLSVGFLYDDYVLLVQTQRREFSIDSLLPAAGWFLYRPMGLLLIWDLGLGLWGYNPFPFQVQGLLVHAVTSLALGLWLAEVTSRRALGWLAGALFAVFPLHLEAVAWVAAHWDALSAMFGILGLWTFTVWWRKGGLLLYFLSLLLYALALFTKDSLVTFLPLFVLSAWLVTPQPRRKELLRGVYALLPFCAVLAFNLGLRLMAWGNLGGYPNVRTDYINFFWDGLVGHTRVLLSPINITVLGSAVAQVVGALSALVLLIGFILYGRKWLRLLVVAGVWVLLALVPVLNLPIQANDLQQNRFLYLASAGYCVIVAVLMYSAVTYTRRWRAWAISAVATILLLSIITCWVQLQPWQTATVQVDSLNQELLRLIPPPVTRRAMWMDWHVESSPHDYKGAYLLHMVVGMPRYFIGDKDVAVLHDTSSATQAPIITDPYDSFALRFGYHQEDTLFHVDYASGITAAGPPPTSEEAGENLLVWDFRDCAPDVVSSWQVREARGSCEPGPTGGVILRENKGDAQLVGPAVAIPVAATGARYIRIRVSVRYPARAVDVPFMGRWYWKGPGEDWSKERRQRLEIKEDGVPHVYWTFVPASEVGEVVDGLRFDPSNGTAAAIQWIALDLVK